MSTTRVRVPNPFNSAAPVIDEIFNGWVISNDCDDDDRYHVAMMPYGDNYQCGEIVASFKHHRNARLYAKTHTYDRDTLSRDSIRKTK